MTRSLSRAVAVSSLSDLRSFDAVNRRAKVA